MSETVLKDCWETVAGSDCSPDESKCFFIKKREWHGSTSQDKYIGIDEDLKKMTLLGYSLEGGAVRVNLWNFTLRSDQTFNLTDELQKKQGN